MSFLIVGGYGEVGRRLAVDLEAIYPGAVIVAGRNPDRAGDMRGRRMDVDEPASIETALEGVDLVIACVRQREPHLLRAAIRRGIAYTSIAPPWLSWREILPLHREARRTGARVVYATGIEPGISSVLARMAADRLGVVDGIETALLLGVGDAYGADSMAFLLEEISQAYEILVDGRMQPADAFGWAKRVSFPAPIGEQWAYTIPFRDQLYYPMTLGARTSIARIALDPPWLGAVISSMTRMGARKLMGRGRAREAVHGLTEKLRERYAGRDQFALVVEVRSGHRVVRSTLVGRQQAQATAAGAAAIAEALYTREQDQPGVWLAEQIIDPGLFLARLAARGLIPVTE